MEVSSAGDGHQATRLSKYPYCMKLYSPIHRVAMWLLDRILAHRADYDILVAVIFHGYVREDDYLSTEW